MQAFSIEYHSLVGVAFTKQASTGREECMSIMSRIYNENPSYWPYGLTMDCHKDVYLIRDNMTKAAAGFVGWQTVKEGDKKIGSYSIGILPEYRGNGFAKEAVAKILLKKASEVDEVRCYVVASNKKSQNLADSLHIKKQTKF